MKIEAKTVTYKPRPNSAASEAVQALQDGPMSASALGVVMGIPSKNVNANLVPAVDGNAIVRVKDENGLLHFALPGMEIDDRLKPYVSKRLTDPNPHDPFGLVARNAQAAASANGHNGLARSFAQSSGPAASTTTVPSVRKVALEPELPKPSPAKTADNEGGFLAGLMSNGELQISAESSKITLSPAHTSCLASYMQKVGLL